MKGLKNASNVIVSFYYDSFIVQCIMFLQRLMFYFLCVASISNLPLFGIDFLIFPSPFKPLQFLENQLCFILGDLSATLN